MIIYKSPQEIERISNAASVAKEVMSRVTGWIHPGVTTLQVDRFIHSQIIGLKGQPSFFGVNGYKYSSCISINEEVVHGLPSKRLIRVGDLVSIDLGVKIANWNSDMCRTVVVGEGKKSQYLNKFIQVGESALKLAIAEVKAGNRVGDISCAIQKEIERHGYSVIRDLSGHGIGRELHEDPTIPCFGNCGTGDLLKVGMTLCIEVMYVEHSPLLVSLPDGWTIRTKDNCISGMVEDMVAITKTGSVVLTR